MCKKNKLNLLIIAVISAVVLGFSLLADSPAKLLVAVKSAKGLWIVCAGLCMVAYWFLESLSLYMVSGNSKEKLRFRDAIQTSMIGQLFNCITPFASGGQPVQAYYMVKSGITPGGASSALLVKFIIYQSVLTIYSLVLLVFKFRFFASQISGFSFLVFIGFIVNAAVVAGLICVGFFPKLTKRALLAISRFLARCRILKNQEKAMAKLETEMDNFSEGFRYLKNNIPLLCRTSVIVALQLTAFFAIPYFICLSLQGAGLDIATVIAAGAFVLMITSFIPLPGSAGGAEGSFYLFFGIFFSQTSVIAVAVLIWRMITFYAPIVVGMCFSRTSKKTSFPADGSSGTPPTSGHARQQAA